MEPEVTVDSATAEGIGIPIEFEVPYNINLIGFPGGDYDSTGWYLDGEVIHTGDRITYLIEDPGEHYFIYKVFGQANVAEDTVTATGIEPPVVEPSTWMNMYLDTTMRVHFYDTHDSGTFANEGGGGFYVAVKVSRYRSRNVDPDGVLNLLYSDGSILSFRLDDFLNYDEEGYSMTVYRLSDQLISLDASQPFELIFKETNAISWLKIEWIYGTTDRETYENYLRSNGQSAPVLEPFHIEEVE
ncbi:MAG: hypothetical protein ABIH52_00700 [Candidatus Aenigmatarchaeota archaeon]|nr:hypothetical protein [Nanoarchaeota archaeon]